MSVSREDKIFLTKNLAIMIKAGVPMAQALVTVKEQSSPDLGKLLKKIGDDVSNGKNLSDAMAKYPKTFDKFYLSLIRAGETSGTLETNLVFLAEQMGKDYALRRKVSGALLYPGLVLSATAIMGTGISWFVLPKLIDMFSSFEVQLPLSTKILMWVAFFMRDYGVFAVFGMVGLIFLFVILSRLKSIKLVLDGLVMKFPFVGQVVVDGEMGRFCRNLGTLLKSGLPVIDAFDTTIDTLSNLKFVKDLKEVRESMKTGKSIFEAMDKKKYTEFSKTATRMIDVGEKSGNLEEMLMYLSDYYEEEIENVSKNLSTLLEPVLLLIIGAVVGFVAMAIISPIYSLIGGIRG